MNKAFLLARLIDANPGWQEWDELIALVATLAFDDVHSEYLGSFYVSDRLTFRATNPHPGWPEWLPTYVPALDGLKPYHWETAGGFADAFSGSVARSGAFFSPAGNDVQLGFPVIDVPTDVFPFQSTSSGALVFVDRQLRILYPNASTLRFEVLDALEDFARTNVRQAIKGQVWSAAFARELSDVVD